MSVHFSKLNKEEIDRKLEAFKRSSSGITIWKKGNEKRVILKPVEYTRNPARLTLDGINPIEEGDILGHFSLNSLSFFLKGNIKKVHNMYIVTNITNFFKAERRTSFRLLTYPHKKVYLKFDIDHVPEKKKDNVVSIETGQSETGLFVNFLDLLNQSNENEFSESIKLRVQDLSATGLCFEVGGLEKEYLEKNKILKDVELSFEELTVKIPMMSIVYIKEHRNFLSNIKVYRVGVEFHEMSEETERELSKKINDYIYKLEKKYEDAVD